VAGKDGKFAPASATVEGTTVLASSPAVADPVYVRYGWANSPECNLFNGEGLPASPFMTCGTAVTGSIRKIAHGVIASLPGTSGIPIAGLAVDADDAVLFASADGRVFKLATGVATPVAGTGVAGFSGDNGPATSAQLSQPSGVSVDASGAIWIADTGNQRIRRIANGVITTAAGAGSPPLAGMPQFGGDGGPAASALLNMPSAAVADSSGRVFVADSYNHRIRVLIPAGSCSAVVNWSALSVGAAGGTLSASILTSSACAWSIAGLPDWIAVAGAASGTGSAAVSLAVAANSGPPRTVTLAVAGNSITIAQAGAQCTVSGHVTLAGQPLAGVSLTLSNQASGLSFEAVTDAAGWYSIAFPAGTSASVLSASLAGYSFLTAQGGVELPSALVLPAGDQTAGFTAWVNPQIGGLTAGFPNGGAQTAFASGEIVAIPEPGVVAEPMRRHAVTKGSDFSSPSFFKICSSRFSRSCA